MLVIGLGFLLVLAPALAVDTKSLTRACHIQHTVGYGFTIYEVLPHIGYGLHLEFSVMTVSDAYLLLSDNIDFSKPYYEILIGGRADTYSSIRRTMNGADIAGAATNDLLSPTEYRGFWIRYLGGSIEVGQAGNSNAFLLANVGVSNLTSVGFASANGLSARWIVDLPSGSDAFTTTDYLYSHYDAAPTYDGNVHLQVAVKAQSDAIVQFSRTSSPSYDTPLYEILIGDTNDGADPMHISVRRFPLGPELNRTDIPGVINANTFTCFWIDIQTTGLITVGREGSAVPIFTYNDPDPLPVAYYSVSSNYAFEGDWEIPCGCSGV